MVQSALDPGDAIIKFIQLECPKDAILIMGCRGRQGWRKMMLGMEGWTTPFFYYFFSISRVVEVAVSAFTAVYKYSHTPGIYFYYIQTFVVVIMVRDPIHINKNRSDEQSFEANFNTWCVCERERL